MINKNTIKEVKYEGEIYRYDPNDTETFLHNVRKLGEQIFDSLGVSALLRDYLCYLEISMIVFLSSEEFNVDGELIADTIVSFYTDDELGEKLVSIVDFLRNNAKQEWMRRGVEWNYEQYKMYLEAIWIWAARNRQCKQLDYAAIFEIVQEIS